MDWKSDPQAVEALEYLLSIGFNAEDFVRADAESSDYRDDEGG